ncbi:MAG: protease family protein [Clostridia bacterium]|nr:protease family protein [Clostridia bacterium]
MPDHRSLAMAGSPEPLGRLRELPRARGFDALRRYRHLLPWVYGTVLTLAELLVAFMKVQAGMYLHIGLLLALLAQATLAHGSREYPLYLTLTLAPLIRILSLSMPLAGFPLVYWYLLTGLPLFAGASVAAYLAGLSLRDCGFRPGSIYQLPVALTGLPLGLAEYLILRPQPLVPELTWADLLLPALILLVFTGFVEELIFRGILQAAARRAMGDTRGLYFVAFIFAVLHITHLSALDVFFVFGVALFFGRVVSRENSLLGVTLAHGLTNISLYLVWPHLL